MAMTLRLDDEAMDALRAAARREGRSMQDIARQAIADYVNARTLRRDAALARIVREDAELLERLAQ